MEKRFNKPYLPPWLLLLQWPDDHAMLFLGGSGRYAALALEHEEVSVSIASSVALQASNGCSSVPFQPGFIGLLSFDRFEPSDNEGLPNRAWRVSSFLVWDLEERRMLLTGELSAETLSFCCTLYDRATTAAPMPPCDGWQWQERAGVDAYLSKARQVLSQIAAGRYYELNLLRYFSMIGSPQKEDIASRLQQVAGAYGAWLRVPSLELVSFSPEQFISVKPESGDMVVRSFPIKGTAPRFSDPEQDQRSRQILATGLKEHAELNMITDLMRHDLRKVSCLNSVQVVDPGTIKKLPHVYHRQSEVRGTLHEGACVRDLWSALCPAGSITGAPKIEVMHAITELEGRSRGYFMGNLAYWAEDGSYLDSSVLIRTMVSTNRNVYEYAAGSGMVLKSDPEEERAEIDYKCRVVMSACPK